MKPRESGGHWVRDTLQWYTSPCFYHFLDTSRPSDKSEQIFVGEEVDTGIDFVSETASAGGPFPFFWSEFVRSRGRVKAASLHR